MLGDDVNTFNQYACLVRNYFKHLAGLGSVLVITGNHHYRVAFLNVELRLESRFHYLFIYKRQAKHWFRLINIVVFETGCKDKKKKAKIKK
jgi:hypothetical protein